MISFTTSVRQWPTQEEEDLTLDVSAMPVEETRALVLRLREHVHGLRHERDRANNAEWKATQAKFEQCVKENEENQRLSLRTAELAGEIERLKQELQKARRR